MSLRVDRGSLLVRDGNTHYPAEKSEFRFFPGDLSRPTQIVMMDGSGSVSLDALDWMAEQAIHLIRLRWNGQVSSLVSPTGYSGDRAKTEWQFATQSDPERRLEFSTQMVRRKLEASLFNLKTMLPPSRSTERAINNTDAAIHRLEAHKPRDVSNLLGFEGQLASLYFEAWQKLPIQWKSVSRHPIPDEWRRFTSRSNLKPKPKNFGAMHPVNAMLNYAYKVLETNIHLHCVIDGYDPNIGILHTGRRNKYSKEPSFVLDLMEPYRPVIDREIIDVIETEELSGADFSIQKDGVCRLNPEMARYIAQRASILKPQFPH